MIPFDADARLIGVSSSPPEILKGLAWFFGSATMGFLYDKSILALVLFSVIAQLAALPVFLGRPKIMIGFGFVSANVKP